MLVVGSLWKALLFFWFVFLFVFFFVLNFKIIFLFHFWVRREVIQVTSSDAKARECCQSR